MDFHPARLFSPANVSYLLDIKPPTVFPDFQAVSANRSSFLRYKSIMAYDSCGKLSYNQNSTQLRSSTYLYNRVECNLMLDTSTEQSLTTVSDPVESRSPNDKAEA